MIITRAFIRESLRSQLALLGVLVAVFALFMLSGLLTRAVRGEFADTAVAALLGWNLLRRVDLLLPLAFYLGTLLTASRWYRDSEMTVLAACGIGLDTVLRSIMRLALAVAALVALLSFYLTPLAGRQIDIAKAESIRRQDPGQMTAGTFTETSNARRVFYAERIDTVRGTLREIFISELGNHRQGVMVAREGEANTVRGERRLVLHQGRIYEGQPGQGDFRIIEFDRYDLRIEGKARGTPPVGVGDLPSLELWRANTLEHRAEWQWRVAKPLAVVVLALYALLFAYTDARRGRMANIFSAIFVYFLYSNLLGMALALMNKGRVPVFVGLWWVHLLMGGLAIYLLGRRARNQPLFDIRWFTRQASR
jgi:lipopolysaccharide export system permease protein